MNLEGVFFRVHQRVAKLVGGLLPGGCRAVAKFACIAYIFLVVIAIALVHLTYVGQGPGADCIASAIEEVFQPSNTRADSRILLLEVHLLKAIEEVHPVHELNVNDASLQHMEPQYNTVKATPAPTPAVAAIYSPVRSRIRRWASSVQQWWSNYDIDTTMERVAPHDVALPGPSNAHDPSEVASSVSRQAPSEGASVASLAAALTGQYHPPPSLGPSRTFGKARYLFAQDTGWLTMAPHVLAEAGNEVTILRVEPGPSSSMNNTSSDEMINGVHVRHLQCLGGSVVRRLAAALGQTDVVALNGLVTAFRGQGFARELSMDESKFWQQRGEVHSIGETPRPLGGPPSMGRELPAAGASRVWRMSLARDVATFRQDFESWVMFKIGTLCAAIFLLFASSSIVSFVLGETQRRMLRFAVMLHNLVEARRPVVWAVLAHAAGSLVFVPVILGVLFFLFEFFGDQLLALLALLAVWACEIYAAVGCRTSASLQIFPFVFAVTFTWFFIYQFSYPFGAHYLALWGVVAGTQCTAAHLYLDYELPALLSGWISQRHMRDVSAGGPWEGVRALLCGPRRLHVGADEALRRARADLERIRAHRRQAQTQVRSPGRQRASTEDVTLLLRGEARAQRDGAPRSGHGRTAPASAAARRMRQESDPGVPTGFGRATAAVSGSIGGSSAGAVGHRSDRGDSSLVHRIAGDPITASSSPRSVTMGREEGRAIRDSASGGASESIDVGSRASLPGSRAGTPSMPGTGTGTGSGLRRRLIPGLPRGGVSATDGSGVKFMAESRELPGMVRESVAGTALTSSLIQPMHVPVPVQPRTAADSRSLGRPPGFRVSFDAEMAGLHDLDGLEADKEPDATFFGN